MYGTNKTRLLRIEARRRPAAAIVRDRSRWDWYALSCSCGLPAGKCREHPRGRPSQRPPKGDWRVWGYVAGRGAGKTRAGACWVQHRVRTGFMKLGCLIAPTMADIRDVMVEGPSGLLAVAPPRCQPRFERQPLDPPAVHAAEGRLPDIQPPAPRRRVDRLPGRQPSRRRLDRRAPRRHPRLLPRGLGATAQPAAGPCCEDPVMSPHTRLAPRAFR